MITIKMRPATAPHRTLTLGSRGTGWVVPMPLNPAAAASSDSTRASVRSAPVTFALYAFWESTPTNCSNCAASTSEEIFPDNNTARISSRYSSGTGCVAASAMNGSTISAPEVMTVAMRYMHTVYMPFPHHPLCIVENAHHRARVFLSELFQKFLKIDEIRGAGEER